MPRPRRFAVTKKKSAGRVSVSSPNEVVVVPRGGATRGMTPHTFNARVRSIDSVVVSGGTYWIPVFSDNAIVFEKPISATIIFADGSTDTFNGADADVVNVYGGTKGGAVSRVKVQRPRTEAVGYDAGLDAILGDAGPSFRGMWDKLNDYVPGDLVYHNGSNWQAVDSISSPWFPTFSSGEVPGQSELWRRAPVTVLGGYTDPDTVKRVQRALIERRGRLFNAGVERAVVEMIKAGKPGTGGIDGVFGPKTQAAVAAFNNGIVGGRAGAGDGPNITGNTLMWLGLETEETLKYMATGPVAPPPPRSPASRSPAPSPPPSGPPTLAMATPDEGIFGVPMWQVGLGILAVGAVSYGAYRLAKRPKSGPPRVGESYEDFRDRMFKATEAKGTPKPAPPVAGETFEQFRTRMLGARA